MRSDSCRRHQSMSSSGCISCASNNRNGHLGFGFRTRGGADTTDCFGFGCAFETARCARNSKRAVSGEGPTELAAVPEICTPVSARLSVACPTPLRLMSSLDGFVDAVSVLWADTAGGLGAFPYCASYASQSASVGADTAGQSSNRAANTAGSDGTESIRVSLQKS